MNYWDRVRANNFDRLVGQIQTEKVMELGVGDSILDIGCGVGQYTPQFLYRFKRVVGLDPSKDYLKEARSVGWRIEYIEGWGETFKLDEEFDTISMNNLLEHVDDPVALLINCKKHLAPKGRIIAQVPNSRSIARQLGVLMGIIDTTDNISEKERDFWGHQRVYTLDSLVADAKKAGLRIIDKGGMLYKPLSNELLWKLYLSEGKRWREKFLKALLEFGNDRPEECAQLFIVCE
jgi:2-polyprenyl-3-methyl-5-hydroxy-6-metoxy-1,4-benzoquinol methylase